MSILEHCIDAKPVRIDVDTGVARSLDDLDRRRHRRSRCRRCSMRTASAAAASSSRVPIVWRLHGEQLQRLLGGAEPILIPDGERFKNLQSVSRIYEALIRAGADRGSAIVAVGGGVIGDTAGFAAATFLRGITLVHVPTTLLAQVDSSIGGKVGVNHALGKNLIGAFHQPALVVDRSAAAAHAAAARVPIRSVRSREIRHDRQPRALRPRRARAPRRSSRATPTCSCRRSSNRAASRPTSCPKDERESGLRRILNFGHTVGHALEAVTKYRRFRHGEAIAYGMLAAADLACARGRARRARASGAGAADRQLGPLPPVADLSIDGSAGGRPARQEGRATGGCTS